MTKPSIEEPPELELKDLLSHLEYAFLEETNKLPVIIAKDLKDNEKDRLLKDLKSHKRAIAWKISDIKGINPQFCTHKILMEDDSKPTVEHQRRVNPKIHEVIKKEVIKLLDAWIDLPYTHSLLGSPVPAKNLAADHLSRLENPHQGDLEKKEINKTFPLEALGMITFHVKKPLISSRLAIMDPPGDIMAKSRKRMKCPKMQFKFARSFTYGASTSWDRSRLLEGTNTFSWPLTTCLNELKRKRSPLMMPELL
ncbi:hypothetical protein Tco_0576310 [Tanacetum coccineum]